MKAGLLLVLLLGMALAGSALGKEALVCTPLQKELALELPQQEISCLLMLDPRATAGAFNVSVVSRLPSGLLAQGGDIRVVDYLGPAEKAKMAWLVSGEPGTYDLSNAFEVVSWDDSVSLQLDPIPEETSESTVTIRGWTDAATLCEKHNYTGFWGKRENCQVKLTVNGKDYWAERSGAFAIEYSLEKGENRIDITAMDPGGNTAEKVVMVSYSPPAGELLRENIVPVVAGTAAVLLLVVVGLYWRSKKGVKELVGEASLESLRERQARLFAEYAQKSRTMAGGVDRKALGELVENFKLILKKDSYYSQRFQSPERAIGEHEPIFADESVPKIIRAVLREQYVKEYRGK